MKEFLALTLSHHEENSGRLKQLPTKLREIIYLMLGEKELFDIARTVTTAYRDSLNSIVRHKMLREDAVISPSQSAIEHFFTHLFSRKVDFFHYPHRDRAFDLMYTRLNSPWAYNKKPFTEFLDALRTKLTTHRMDILRTSLTKDNYALIFSAAAEKEWQILTLMLSMLAPALQTHLLIHNNNIFIEHLVHHLTADYDHPQRDLQLGFDVLTQLLTECTTTMALNLRFEVLIHLSAAHGDHALLANCLRLAPEHDITVEYALYDENAITKAIRRNDLTTVSMIMKRYEEIDYDTRVLSNRAHHLLRLAKAKRHDAIVEYLTTHYYDREMMGSYCESNERYLLHQDRQHSRCTIL